VSFCIISNVSQLALPSDNIVNSSLSAYNITFIPSLGTCNNNSDQVCLRVVVNFVDMTNTCSRLTLCVMLTLYLKESYLGIPIPEGFFKTGISVLDRVKTGIPVFRRY